MHTDKKYNSTFFFVPAFISFRVYDVNDNGVFAYIFNHLSNEFIVLSDLSALLWDFLSETRSYEEISHFALKYAFIDEIDLFLDELLEIGLIQTSIASSNAKIGTSVFPILPKLENDSDASVEITDFCTKHGYMSRLFLEMTYNCNLKCVHCFNDKSLINKFLKFEDAKRIIDDAYSLGCFFVTMSGGECTLNPDFLKILQYISSKHLAFDFYTNGQVLFENKQLLDNIIDLFPYRISLSLYSMNPEIHDKITGVNGSFKKTMHVINYLKSKNINVHINCFITTLNPIDYKDIVLFANDNNFGYTIDYKFLSNPSNNNQDIKIKPEQIMDLYLDKDSIFYIKNIKPHSLTTEFFNKPICKGGKSDLLVSPELDICICPALKIKIGNYKTNSLIDIWNNKDPKFKLNKIKSFKNSDLKDCFKHDYCKYCLYCPGSANMLNSYMKKVNQFCEISKKIMEAEKIINQ